LQQPAITLDPSPEPGPAATPVGPWRRAIRFSLAIWGLSRLGLVAVTLIAGYADGYDPGFGLLAKPPDLNLVQTWYRLDTGWFVDIATHGYDQLDKAAFFPLYPALIKVTSYLTFGDAVVAAIIVANVCMIGALAVLYRLTEHEFSAATARRAGWLLVAFPTGFYLGVGYNTSLFLLLAAGCWYAMRVDRWWLAGALGGLAATTRTTGVLLLLPFVYEYLRQHGRRIRWDGLAVVLIPGGLACVLALFWSTYDDPLAFVRAQQVGWGRRLDWPWTATAKAVQAWATSPEKLSRFESHDLLAVACVVLLLATVVAAFVGPVRLRRDLYALPLFGAAEIIVFLCARVNNPNLPLPLMSLPRLALEVFPAFIVLARIESEWFRRAYLAVALPLQGIIAVAFVLGYWAE
jgi:hypothetical protein